MTNNISIMEALRRVSKTAQEYIDKNTPHVISEKVVLTVPAATISAKKTEIDNASEENVVQINVNGTVTVDPTKSYYIKYNNKQYSASTNEGRFMIVGDDCLCRIDTTQNGATMLLIGKLDTTNITDMQLIEKDVKKLDNMYVPNDLRVSNSITVGARQGEIGLFSSTFGSLCEASGVCSHAEGEFTTASGYASHAEGEFTTASSDCSHAEGSRTTASSDYQHVQGKYNIEDTEGKYAHIVGNGTDVNKRSNAHTLDWAGNAWFAGDVQANNVPYVVGEEVVLTVPAATITAKKTDIDNADYDNCVEITVDGSFIYDETKDYLLKYNGVEYPLFNNYGFYVIEEENCALIIEIQESTDRKSRTIIPVQPQQPQALSTNSPIVVQDANSNDSSSTTASTTNIRIFRLDTTNITDILIIEKTVNRLDNLYLSHNLMINNSLSVGFSDGDIGQYSVGFGVYVNASGDHSTASGSLTIAYGEDSHAEGHSSTSYTQLYNIIKNVIINGSGSGSEQERAVVSDNENMPVVASLSNDIAVQEVDSVETFIIVDNNKETAFQNKDALLYVWGNMSSFLMAHGEDSHAEGYDTLAFGRDSHAEGMATLASGDASHAEGTCTTAYGHSSHAEGISGVPLMSLIENSEVATQSLHSYDSLINSTNLLNLVDNGEEFLIAFGDYSHAEGEDTVAIGTGSHSEGHQTIAFGNYSHAEGAMTTASGSGSHAEGTQTTASGDGSHAEGEGTVAAGTDQHVQGKYNVVDNVDEFAHIVGNGTSESDLSNAHTLDWSGNAWFAGKVSQEDEPTEDNDLATKKYVDDHTPKVDISEGFVMRDQATDYRYMMQMINGVLTSTLLPSSISVDTSSLQGVTFMEGDAIDLETLTFMANYPDGTSSKITDTENLSYTPSELTTDVTQISFVYSIGGLKLTYDMPITVTAFDPAVKLQDFEYTTNDDGTYTLTGWKETHNGVASTELIIPNNKKIIL